MSKTGNKSFTLIEVMIAACVLSLTAVLIYEAFFITLDSFDYYVNYMDVIPWMDEKIWRAQDNLNRLGPAASQIEASGDFANRNKNFKWDLSYSPAGGTNLYQIDLALYWHQGKRNVKMLRSAYALYEEKK